MRYWWRFALLGSGKYAEFLDASGYSGSNVNPDLLVNYESIIKSSSISNYSGCCCWLEKLSNKYGNIPIEDILDIGINLCHEGFKVNKELYNSLNIHHEELSGQIWIFIL